GFEGVGGGAGWGLGVLEGASVLAAPSTGGGGSGFALGRLSPNPARHLSRVEFTLPATGVVRLSLHDVQGRQPLGTLVNERLAPGLHSRSIPLDRLRPGLNWLQLEWNGEQRSARMVVLP